ncbi:MAG TPA: SDR family oxidoreductase [Ilumatobacter sp.]|nr:SDR family oxidoreductase [Ilumatobacter sp.]
MVTSLPELHRVRAAGSSCWFELLVRASVLAAHAARRGQPDDIAGVVLFLADADAGWVTGQTIQVAGGQML